MPVLDQRGAVTREQQDNLFLLSFPWDANGRFAFDAKKCVDVFYVQHRQWDDVGTFVIRLLSVQPVLHSNPSPSYLFFISNPPARQY